MSDAGLVLQKFVAGRSEPFGRDLFQGVLAWPLWTMLGWNDIHQRYRRSVLGPIWITLSMAIFIAVLTVIYGRIFQVDTHVFMPYVSLGLVLWTFISGSANEACGAFQESDRIIKQLRIPYSAFVLRVVWRNFIVLLHTITLYIPIALTFSVELRLTGLLALPGLFFLLWNQVWLGIVIAIVSVRYRDVPQLVATALQITMFATPIMWPVATLGGDTWIVDVNPAYHLIELIRAPLLGTAPASLSWAVVAGMCTLGTLFAMLLQRCASRQLVYWL